LKLPLKIESRAEYYCKRIKIDTTSSKNDVVRTKMIMIKNNI